MCMAKLGKKKEKGEVYIFPLGESGFSGSQIVFHGTLPGGWKGSSQSFRKNRVRTTHNNTMMDSTIYTLLIPVGQKVQVRFSHKMLFSIENSNKLLTNPLCALMLQKHWWSGQERLWQPPHSSHFQHWKQERCPLKRVLDEAVKVHFIKPQLLNI